MTPSTTSQNYARMLSILNHAIDKLTQDRTDILASYRASQLSDVLSNDESWLAQAKVSAPDWAALLDTRTSISQWKQAVEVEGVTGHSEWAQSEQRAITFTMYKEIPERQALYAWLIEAMMDHVKPWSMSISQPQMWRCVSIRSAGGNLQLGKMADGAWWLRSPSHSQGTAYPDVAAALVAAQKRTQSSFFPEEG